MSHSISRLLACMALAALHQASAYKDKPKGRTPFEEYPGGWYSESTVKELPASTSVSGSVIKLKPGGLREVHWHTTDEFGMVIEGNCRMTAIDSKGMSDTWDFGPLDIWAFPANTAHAILGLPPKGCHMVAAYNDGRFSEVRDSFSGSNWAFPANTAHAILGLPPKGCHMVAAYNDGRFSEVRDSFSGSNWLPSVPDDVLAQSLGVSIANVTSLKANLRHATFMPMGKNPKHMAADKPGPLKSQFVPLIHHFPTQTDTFKNFSDGSYINAVDGNAFPVLNTMAFIGGVVRVGPYGLRQLHWHLVNDEWDYVINGTVTMEVFNASSSKVTTYRNLTAGDLGFAAAGYPHYIKNLGPEPAYLLLIFRRTGPWSSTNYLSDIEVNQFLGIIPPSWTATSLNTTERMVKSFDYSLTSFAPAAAPPS